MTVELAPPMTRAEFDALPSDRRVPCPDCGQRTTTPYPGCGCPPVLIRGVGYFTKHINEYHHRCDPVRLKMLADSKRRESI
jgi:hypothetical protein